MQKSQPSGANTQLFSGVIERNAIEDMAGAVRNFFDLEAVQLEPGPCRCKIDFIAAGKVFFYLEHYPLRTHLSGELLHNRFGFALPMQGPNVKFAGEHMEPSRLASAITGEEFDLFAAGGLKQLVVLLDHRRLLDLADEVGLPAETQSALRPGRPTKPLGVKPGAVVALGRRLRGMLRAASAGELTLDAEGLQDWLYAQTISLLDATDSPCGRPPAAVLVRRAVEAAEAHRGPVRVGHLCRTLRVSPGTLENAFKVVAGVTPHAFFLRRRLSQVREVLLREDPLQRKVTDIASEFGFSELGRFSVRYREMFGEKPSDTLNRSVTTRVSLAR